MWSGNQPLEEGRIFRYPACKTTKSLYFFQYQRGSATSNEVWCSEWWTHKCPQLWGTWKSIPTGHKWRCSKLYIDMCILARYMVRWVGSCRSVQRQDADTLLPITQQVARPGSTIWSDDWRAYRGVAALPTIAGHAVVNHSVNFFDQVTGVHTQNAKFYWNRVKTKLKRMRGYHEHQLPSYLEMNLCGLQCTYVSYNIHTLVSSGIETW